jgi:pyruvate,water dikinase
MQRAEESGYVRWFKDIRLDEVASVGGKNASLGELYSTLSGQGIKVPNGFVLTAPAYRDALTKANAWQKLHHLLDPMDKRHIGSLRKRAAEARNIVHEATDVPFLQQAIAAAYRELEQEYGANVAVAVRSSATAEDLPTASFAGQHESFLNIRGERAVVEACRRCFASIFTDRAISYRIDNEFDHFKVALSVGVMKMIRSDQAASGVVFTLDTESGFRDVAFITGSYGLGENIVQGAVDPDEFYVHKPTFRRGFRAVLSHALGRKQRRMIYARRNNQTTHNVETSKADRDRFCIDDADVLTLAGCAITIEDHYSKKAGRLVPMDIEWAKDGPDGDIYIVQARPETVASRRLPQVLETYALKENGRVLATGRAVGEKIASGRTRIIKTARDLASFRPGEVLVAPATSPDWEPVMKAAAAIVTERGGRTCHAAIVARELGVPAVVGVERATKKLRNGSLVTVCCAEGEIGKVYEGRLGFDITRAAGEDTTRLRTSIMLNLGDPELAFHAAMLPNDGVGLARMEFIISEHIGIHPMALVELRRVKSKKIRATIKRLTRHHEQPADFFIERLAEGIGTIAGAFYPKPVIVRLSDFKTNEYASLIGGKDFEPREANPMIGFRGASRYAHPAYAAGFALECAALARVRNTMGLDNVRVMIPFCRRIEEAIPTHGLHT